MCVIFYKCRTTRLLPGWTPQTHTHPFARHANLPNGWTHQERNIRTFTGPSFIHRRRVMESYSKFCVSLLINSNDTAMSWSVWVGLAWAVTRALCFINKRLWGWLPEVVLLMGVAACAYETGSDEWLVSDISKSQKIKRRNSAEAEAACSDHIETGKLVLPDSAEDLVGEAQEELRSRARNSAATCGLEALAETAPELPRPVAVELGRLIDLVVRDYVASWYRNVSDDPTFVRDVRCELASVLAEVGRRCLDRLNLVAFALDTIADAATLQLRAHGEARASARLVDDADNDELARLIEAADNARERSAAALVVAAKRRNEATLRQLRATGKLHPAFTWQQHESGDELVKATASLGVGERKYLRHVAARLIRIVAPAELHACRAVRHLLRELVANVVLAVAVEAFRPENVVCWIDKLLSKSRSSAAPPAAVQTVDAAAVETSASSAVTTQPPEAEETVTPKATAQLPVGAAPTGFLAGDSDTAWSFFAGEMDTERAADVLAGKGEGAFLIRVDPSLNVTEDRDPSEPLEFVLSYLVNERDLCNVVIFGDPSGPTFEYVRFGGGRRDARLVDRASQLAYAPPCTTLHSLLHTHFEDVAFKGLVFDELDTTSSKGQGRCSDLPAADTNSERALSDSVGFDVAPRTRTPMPHELCSDDDERLFAEQKRHVLLIELQAAIEMAEDTAGAVEDLINGMRAKHSAAARTAASLERMLFSKEALERQARRRERELEQKVDETRATAWLGADGAHRVHRIVSAINAVLQHGGAGTAGKPAMYCAYLLEAAPKLLRAKLHPEAVEAASLCGASEQDDEQPQLQREAAGIAWIVDALRSSTVHSVLFDAAADAALTRNYYGPDAILREPSDAARFLWFAERLDGLKVRPPIAALKEQEPVLYCYCVPTPQMPDSVTAATCAKKNSNKLWYSGGGGDANGGQHNDPPSSYFSVSALARAATSSAVLSATDAILEGSSTRGKKRRQLVNVERGALTSSNCELEDDGGAMLAAVGARSSPKGRARLYASTRNDIVDKARVAMARAASLESQEAGHNQTAAVRVNYLLRRRPARTALVERGLLPRKRVGQAQSARVVAEDSLGGVAASRAKCAPTDGGVKAPNFLESLQTAGSTILSTAGGLSTAKTVLQSRTTFYRIWLLAPVTPTNDASLAASSEGEPASDHSQSSLDLAARPVISISSSTTSVAVTRDVAKASAPIVMPVSRGRAYARRRYRDFRALRCALSKAMSQDRAAKLPLLPPRRLAERLYSRGAPALETRRIGLEKFVSALLHDPALRESHEVRAFVFANRDEMRRILRTFGIKGNAHQDDNRFCTDDGDMRNMSFATLVEDEDEEEDDDEEDEEEDDYEDELGDLSPSNTARDRAYVTNDSKQVRPSTEDSSRPTSGIEALKLHEDGLVVSDGVSTQKPVGARFAASDLDHSMNAIGPTPTAQTTKSPALTAADWRRLKRVEHRTYMLLRELFDVDHMGLMRRNFVALLRRGARALWSPAMASWLGERAVRDARVKLLTTLTSQLNDLVWPGGMPRASASQQDFRDSDRSRLDAAVAAAELRKRLAAAIPTSFASLVGQSSTDDAVAKLHELVLCPIQLRSLAYTLLDLLLVSPRVEIEALSLLFCIRRWRSAQNLNSPSVASTTLFHEHRLHSACGAKYEAAKSSY